MHHVHRADDAGPPDPPELACAICGLVVGLCECPECPVCGVAGDPECAGKHVPLYTDLRRALKAYAQACGLPANIPDMLSWDARKAAWRQRAEALLAMFFAHTELQVLHELTAKYAVDEEDDLRCHTSWEKSEQR